MNVNNPLPSDPENQELRSKPHTFPWKWIFLILLIAAFITWNLLTPPGFFGKLHAIGYAVCHQIEERSLHLGETHTTLCMRCTGMYLGAMLGLIFQLIQGKKGAYPPKRTIIVMTVFVLAFALDGINSYLSFFPSIKGLYLPQNTFRLITGMGMGLALASALVPAFHQTIWKTWDDSSAIATWKQLCLLIGLAALLTVLVLTDSAWVIYPAAIISTFGVPILLTIIYTMVWAMLLRRDNSYHSYKEILTPLLGGALTAIGQIGVFDLVRYLLTGTWAGFNL
jgi:uncharacterized membrane protein